MYTWFVIIVSVCLAALIFRRRDGKKLPPGPSFLSSNFLLLTISVMQGLRPIITNLKSKYGPLITFSFGSRPLIFICSQDLAHEILIQKSSSVADRPSYSSLEESCTITKASYGSTWRFLRRNLATEILQPSRVKSYSGARKWALQILIGRLQQQQQQEEAAGVKVIDHFEHAMFSLFALMCFGMKLDEHRINEIISKSRDMLFAVHPGNLGVNILCTFPRLGKILLRKKWKDILQKREDQEKVMLPLVKSRIEAVNNSEPQLGGNQMVAYVDTLMHLQLPEENANNGNGGKLTDKDLVSLCNEFLNAGTDTTISALQWIMANLVKYPHIQRKLYDEIVSVVGPPPPLPPPGVELKSFIREEDLQNISYLKAVVLEGLRRHSPAPFVLPHRAQEEAELRGFTIPRGATVNFTVADMGLDPKVWDDPVEFKPERFLQVNNGVFDVTGRKGIKMMPFGVGKRMCPGYALGLLHLESFVANLIWYFHWTPPNGDHDVDLTEKAEFTIVMMNPLQAKISSRTDKITT
ncbi:hypothetical protein Lser_V15G15407 [Lactuca serriola]